MNSEVEARLAKLNTLEAANKAEILLAEHAMGWTYEGFCRQGPVFRTGSAAVNRRTVELGKTWNPTANRNDLYEVLEAMPEEWLLAAADHWWSNAKAEETPPVCLKERLSEEEWKMVRCYVCRSVLMLADPLDACRSIAATMSKA